MTDAIQSAGQKPQRHVPSLAGIAAVTLVTLFCGEMARPVRAQSVEPPSNAPFQAGPLTVSPTIRLTNVGHDSNVFNRNADDNPQGDYTAKLSPLIEAWLRLPHARLTVRSQFDFYYFRQLTDLRAMDTDNAVRLDFPLNRLTPYFDGAITNTRHRQNLEIDAIAQRRNETLTAGAELRLTPKVFAAAYSRRSGLEYEPNSLYLGTDLSRELNHTSTGEGVSVRYVVTPFTTLTVEMERTRDRFDSATERDGDAFRLVPTLTFSPFALVSGRASFGYQSRKFLTGGLPAVSGTIASVDLNYTLLARTRFAVAARRQLEYSYLVGQYQYVNTGITLSVTQRLGDSWDIGGSLGRDRLDYTQVATPTNPGTVVPDESIRSVSVDMGYDFGRARIGLLVEHRQRIANEGPEFRGYQRFRIGATVTYVF